MKKYTILVLFLLFTFSLSGWAQEKTSLGKSDPQAKSILDKTSRTYKDYHSMKADFTMNITDAHGKSLKKDKGTIWLKDEAFKFYFGSLTVFSDGQSLWTYNKDNNEVQITDYDPADDEITPSRIFNDFYDKNLLYKLNGTETINGSKTQVIEMTPLDKSKSYFKILTWIKEKNHQIAQMEVFEKNGMHYTYTINNFEPDVHFEASQFSFSKKNYPGVSVQDLRL